MKVLNEAEEEPAVPMTPMIDVVFQLILFFLVSTTLYKIEKDLVVTLPEASGGVEAASEQKRIVVNVRQGGLLVMDGRIVTHEQLARDLAAAARRNPSVSVVIRGDRKAFHGDVVRILNECNIRRISVSVAVYPVEGAPSEPSGETGP